MVSVFTAQYLGVWQEILSEPQDGLRYRVCDLTLANTHVVGWLVLYQRFGLSRIISRIVLSVLVCFREDMGVFVLDADQPPQGVSKIMHQTGDLSFLIAQRQLLWHQNEVERSAMFPKALANCGLHACCPR